MSQKRLLVVAFLFFVASVFFLFWKNTSELSPTKDQSWWALGFVDVGDKRNPSFFIENRSGEKSFTYTVRTGALLVKEASLEVNTGEKKEVVIDMLPEENTALTRIEVKNNSSTKEIYR